MSVAAFRLFHNRLRVMRSIDMHELVEGGVIAHWDREEWNTFSRDPYRWLIGANDEAAEKLWAIIERRAPEQEPI